MGQCPWAFPHTHSPVRWVSLPLMSFVFTLSALLHPYNHPVKVRKVESSSWGDRCHLGQVPIPSEAQALLRNSRFYFSILFSVWQATLPPPETEPNTEHKYMRERRWKGSSRGRRDCVSEQWEEGGWCQRTYIQTPAPPLSSSNHPADSHRTRCENCNTGWSRRPPYFTCDRWQ